MRPYSKRLRKIEGLAYIGDPNTRHLNTTFFLSGIQMVIGHMITWTIQIITQCKYKPCLMYNELVMLRSRIKNLVFFYLEET